MNKPIKCIIIDLDGTLINSGPDLIDSLNFVLKKQKLEIVQSDVIGSLVGGGAMSMIDKAYKHLKLNVPQSEMKQMVSDFLEFYYKNCDKKSYLYSSVYKTLQILKPKFKIALCTNKKQHLTEKILESYKIESFFDFVLGSNINLKLKPNTEMLEYCLKQCGANNENSIMIGDSNNDIIPAKKLSMKSIFVSYGYGDNSESSEADFVIDNFKKVIEIVKS